MISILVNLLRWIIRYQDIIDFVLLLIAVFLLGFGAGRMVGLHK